MIQQSMENAEKLIPKIDKEYADRFGFRHGGLLEPYRCEDSDLILITAGTMATEAKIAVDKLRNEGVKVGSARIRVLRPFPKEDVRRLVRSAQMVAVIDRGVSFGMEGFMCEEIKASVYGEEDCPPIAGFIAGLGGRDVTFQTIERVARMAAGWLQKGKAQEKPVWVDLKE